MKKTDLIKELNKIPGDPEIFILDLVKNASAADACGTSDGVYLPESVEYLDGDLVPIDSQPFITISFEPKTI